MAAWDVFRNDLMKDKTVLITGGGTGMGEAMTHAFSALGARVLIASRNAEHLQPVAEAATKASGNEVLWKTCDVRDVEQVQALADYASDNFDGALDVLVNNAAGNFLTPFDAMSHNAWNTVVGIVLGGTHNMLKATFPLLSKRGGAVTNMVATYAWGAAPLVSHSGAAKAGVLNLTKSLAVEWASHRIRLNAVAPGPVDTHGAGSRLFAEDDTKQTIIDSVPWKRFGTVDEMAAAVVYLSSPAADYVTGECLTIDGGQVLTNGLFA